jgi:ribosome-binding factor A
MPTRRLEQINELIRQELSVLIAREIKDPRIHSLTSVTSVETTPDLRHARVFVSVLGNEDDQKQALTALRSASGFLRHELAVRLSSMRRVPDLDIRQDKSIERGERIMGIIRQLQKSSSTDSTADES